MEDFMQLFQVEFSQNKLLFDSLTDENKTKLIQYCIPLLEGIIPLIDNSCFDVLNRECYNRDIITYIRNGSTKSIYLKKVNIMCKMLS